MSFVRSTPFHLHLSKRKEEKRRKTEKDAHRKRERYGGGKSIRERKGNVSIQERGGERGRGRKSHRQKKYLAPPILPPPRWIEEGTNSLDSCLEYTYTFILTDPAQRLCTYTHRKRGGGTESQTRSCLTTTKNTSGRVARPFSRPPSPPLTSLTTPRPSVL